MNDNQDPNRPAQPFAAQPVQTAGTTIITQVQPQRSLIGSFFRWIFMIAVPVFSAFLFGFFVGIFGATGLGEDLHLNERTYSGNNQAKDKIAIVKIEGVIMEGTTQ